MNKKKRKVFLIVGVVSLVIIGALYYIYHEIKQERQYQLVYIPKVIDEENDFWTSLIAGANMAAKEYNAKLTVVAGDSEEDWESQNELIEWAISENVDAILISPCSYTKSTEELKKAKAKGIKIIMVDSVVDEEIEDLIISTDNQAAGIKLGKYAVSLLNLKDEVAIVGNVEGTSTAIEREAGIRVGMGDMEENIKEVVFCGSQYGKAYELAVSLTRKYPNLAMIIGLNEYSAVGVARAIHDLGLKGKVQVIGFDSSIEQVQLMEEGIFQGIVIQKPFNMGYLGVEQTIQLLKGKKVEQVLDSGSELITMENLYTEENQKLVFPFMDE